MLQSKAGVENREYKAQRAILADVDAGKISKEELFTRAEEVMKERMPSATPHKPAAPRPAAPAPAVATAPIAATTPRAVAPPPGAATV